MSRIDIDTLYDGFCSGLPSDLEPAGRTLAGTLGLAPSGDIAWSAVFKSQVTLQAPALLAEGMPEVPRSLVEQAVLSHLLSVIEAFGADRIADRQVEDTPLLRRLLACFRAARDEALEAVGGASLRGLAREADERTHDAIAREHAVLLRGDTVDFETYRAISAGKQAVGLPGSLALVRAANRDDAVLERVRATLMGVWLGLQFEDDVADWEDDMARGGAWVVLLAGIGGVREHGNPAAIRRAVLASGVQAEVLDAAAAQYTEAAEGARILEARTLARWAEDRATEARAHAEGERRTPGYVLRLRKLGAWKDEVLA